MRDYRGELAVQLLHFGDLLHGWMEQERAAAERRLGLAARDPGAIQDESYAAALAAWASWRDVIDDIRPLLAATLPGDERADAADDAGA